MALPYDKALQEWGARKLRIKYPNVEIDLSTVDVEQDFSAGFGCETCGVEVESEINIYGRSEDGRFLSYRIEGRINFADFIKEVVEAGEGTITSE